MSLEAVATRLGERDLVQDVEKLQFFGQMLRDWCLGGKSDAAPEQH